jgi:TolB-like protein
MRVPSGYKQLLSGEYLSLADSACTEKRRHGMAPDGKLGASTRGFSYRNFLLVLVVLLWTLPVAVGAGAPQTGAVPLPQGIADLADRLTKGMPADQVMTVAVTDFPDSIRNQTCGLGRFVAERLTTLLSQHHQCRLIERRRLDLVLGELKFGMSELVDPAKAKKLGQMLGVQGLVVGSVTDLGGTVDVDARIIDIQTNVSLPGASTSIVQDEVTKRLIGDCGLTGPMQGVGGTDPVTGLRVNTRAEHPQVTAGEITINVQSCEMRGTTITCALTLTDTGGDQRFGLVGNGEQRASSFFDEAGNEHHATSVGLADVRDPKWASSMLIEGVTTGGKLVFANVPPEVSEMSELIIACSDEHKAYDLKLRNIALAKQVGGTP